MDEYGQIMAVAVLMRYCKAKDDDNFVKLLIASCKNRINHILHEFEAYAKDADVALRCAARR